MTIRKVGDLVWYDRNSTTNVGIVVAAGPRTYDVAWLDGSSTSRYTAETTRSVLTTEAEVRRARGYPGFDPIARLHKLRDEVRAERRPGMVAARGGYHKRRGGGP
jgi:hypothetical protein